MSYTVFFTTSLSTTQLILLKSPRASLGLSTSKLSSLVFRLDNSSFIPSWMYQCLLLLSNLPPLHGLIDPIQLLHFYQNFSTNLEIIDSPLFYIFHIKLAIELLLIALPYDVQFTTFCLDYCFNPEPFLTGLLELFFTDWSNNLCTIKDTIRYFGMFH